MRATHFFVDRPIFASVISILIVLVGGIAYVSLPVAQYPEIAPPSITVTATYPGASAEVVSDTVAAVIEQQINGVENMLYMKSENTATGTMSLSIVFEPGTDLDTAQVLVQNRVALAEPLLPEPVQRQGVNVRKNSPDLMMVIHILSPDDTRESLYVSNYARSQIVDRLARIDGVGEARLFAERAYAMRVWIDPDRAAGFGLTAGEIVSALQQNNVQVAAGALNKLPIDAQKAFELTVETQGRLLQADEFSNVIVKRGVGGRTVRVRDVARVELAAQDYSIIGYLDDKVALPIGIFQRPGSNALDTADALRTEMQLIGQSMPSGIGYEIVYDPTIFIRKSVDAIYITIISLVVSLTLSPALCAMLFLPHGHGAASRGPLRWIGAPGRAFARAFNRGFDGLAAGYAGLTQRLVRLSVLVLVIYAGLIAVTVFEFRDTPTGFIPAQDQGYLITVIKLPPGASMSRTDAVVREASRRLREVDGVSHTVGLAGLDGATFTTSSDSAVVFLPLDPFEDRVARGLDSGAIAQQAQAAVAGIREALAFVIAPPPVRGVGSAGGWKLYLQDRTGRGVELLHSSMQALTARAGDTDGLTQVFSFFNMSTPRIYADIDRTKAEMLRVPAERVLEALEVYLGSAYVNDFNFLGRTYRVTAQADGPFRDDIADIGRYRARSEDGAMVPIGTLATFENRTGPARLPRYNLYPAIEVQGSSAAGVSTGEAIVIVEALLAEVLPDGIGFEWTELALQEKLAGDTALLTFGLAVVFVFLLLAALYESWMLPLAVVLIVPMCLLASIIGVNLRGLDNNILVQIGFVVLIGLAAKNAILIVEFARQAEARGETRAQAAVEAARTRLRPILMTSFAFIFGVVPLMLASGAGAEMRQALSTAVFSGMLGVTAFGLLFTPVFYVTCRWLATLGRRRDA